MEESLRSHDAEFWLSKEGGLEHRRLLEERFEHFRANASRKKTFKGSSFDLVVLSDFPNPGMTFHSTYGMSDFILWKADKSGIRQELSWTTISDGPLEYVENVLLNLGMMTLENGKPLDAGITLPQYPLSTHLPSELTVTTMLTRVQLWLDETEFVIEEYFPTFLVEIAGLTDSEVALLSKNEDEFYRRCEAEEIDFLDLKRESLRHGAI